MHRLPTEIQRDRKSDIQTDIAHTYKQIMGRESETKTEIERQRDIEGEKQRQKEGGRDRAIERGRGR